MLIQESTFRGSTKYQLEQFLFDELNNSNYDGAIEELSDKMKKQAKFIAALTNHLADRMIVDEQFVRQALRGYDDESLTFHKE